MNILTFSLDGDRYGIDARAVRFIERAVAVTPLPRAPDLVEGVIDVHGTLTPVFDLRRRFGRAPQPLRESEHLIVASNGDRLVAFRVDEALDLVDAGTSVDQLPPFADGPAGEGIVRLPDGAVAIYDLPTFLSAAERVALEEALRS